nr:hypothetical protein [Oscillospiraceae bacterium]
MKLIECYIENFGRISKQKFSFKDGLNCIKEDNGSGKTTLAAFIKAMLYGIGDTKKISLDENDRKRYLPWQGGACGGSLTFSAGEKTYRIERSFGAKASEDSFTLYDTSTGRASGDFPEAIGEALFGIDADGFERTVFLSERALTPKSDNKSISAKLSDLVGCDGDIGGMDEAMKVLENRRKFYHKKGGSGELSEVQARIDELTRRLNSLGETEKALENEHSKMKDIARKIEAARADGKSLLKQREAATIRAAEQNHEKRYAMMKAELEDAIKRRTIVSEIFGTEIPTFSDIDEASYKATEAKNLINSATDMPEMREFKALAAKYDGKVDRAQIEASRSACEALKNTKHKEADPRLNKAKRIFSGRVPAEEEIGGIECLLAKDKRKMSLGIFAYIPFVVLCIIGIILELILTAVGLVGIIVTAIIEAACKSKAKNEKKKKIDDFFLSVSGVSVQSDEEAAARLADMSELLAVINQYENEDKSEELMKVVSSLISIFPEHYGREPIGAAEEIIKEYERYAELSVAERYMRGDRTARLDRAEKLQAESDLFVKKYRTRTPDPFTELRSALTEYERLTALIVAKRDEMASLENQHSLGQSDQRRAMLDIETIDGKIRANDELVANLNREYTLAERLYNSCIEELDSRDELYMRRAELEDTLEKHKDNYNTVILTRKYINLAKDNMTARYLGKTMAGFLKYAEIIGGISGESFEMNTDFGITKQEGASTRSLEAYSRGTRDLFNLASRLALVDSLYEKEKPFIILDDPFTAFDDKKIDAALKLLREFSKERQIIYFTCSKARSI